MKTDKKFYVVWKGEKPGIYNSWNDCRKQVEGIAGARYKSFPTLQEAEKAFREGAAEVLAKESFAGRVNRLHAGGAPIIWESVSVDAACQGNPGKMEYRGVETFSGRELFHAGPYEQGTNNIGEFLALVHALAALKKKQLALPVYTDSRTARKWLIDKKINTKLVATPQNQAIFDLVARALAWLRANEYNNPVLTWNTEEWGEIPADFGRK